MGLLDAANRGIVGGLLGAPVDLVNLAVQADKPVGGSEWWGDQMQRAGIVGDERNPMAETAMGLLAPGAAIGVAGKADDVARMMRMQAMGMERGWWRGGPKPVDGRRTGPWYTTSKEQASDYAKRHAPNDDVREYAVPEGPYFSLGLAYEAKLAKDVAKVLSNPYYGDKGKAMSAMLEQDYVKAGQPIDGGALWSLLKSRLGQEDAADVLSKTGGFAGVKGLNAMDDVYVFKSQPVRDATKAKFDPKNSEKDDIYGFATPATLLGMAASGAAARGLLEWHRNSDDADSRPYPRVP